MTTIDWNDPDFCKKYQYYDGIVITAVHVLPEWANSNFPILLKLADGRTPAITRDNKYWSDSKGRDCVVPCEPRTIEGWVKPEVFNATDRGAHGVLTYQPQRPEEWVKIKMTEVIE